MDKPKKAKNKGGRPTKYTDDIPQKLIDFFNRPLRTKKIVQQATARGVVDVEIEQFCDPPFIESFCAELLISKQTFYRWVDEKDEFRDAFNTVKPIQAKVLLIGAMQGSYNSSISKLVLANCTDYREKREETESKEIKVVLSDDRATKL
jgi:hypothetical protein